MIQILHGVLKSDEVQIAAILLLYVILAYVIKLILKLGSNHLAHTDAAIEETRRELKSDIDEMRKEFMREIRSINEFLRGQ